MSDLYNFKNYSVNNNSSLNGDISLRQAKTFQTPLLGLLLAASVLAKSTQAKPYFLGYGQSPWYPLKSLYHNLPTVSQLWHPISGNVYPRYTQISTSAPQILPPPLNQQQSVNIHETPPERDLRETEEADSGDVLYPDHVDNSSEIPVEEDAVESEEVANDLQADSSNLIKENATDFATTEEGFLEDEDFQSTIKRDRRTTPSNIRRVGTRRPINDYMDSKSRRRPTRRRTTTPNYDYNLSNRRRKRPTKNRNRPNNRRPINKDAEFYDSSQYDEDYYDEYYPNNVDVFARQDSTTTETTISTTTEPTTTTPTPSPTTSNHTYGYTYGPPVQSEYGPPGQTGYGPPQTGYGSSNGHEYVSITYPPLTDPGRDVLAPLLDSLYNQYSKSSIIRRLQELLQPNNFYNSQQYDVNYPENF